MRKLIERCKGLEKFVRRWWFGPLLALLAGLDHYLLVIPTVGLLTSSVLLAPRRWLAIALWTSIGSWLGILLLGYLTQALGLTFIAANFPAMIDNSVWDSTQGFFIEYGSWVVFAANIFPIPQQPAVIIAALAGTPLLKLSAVLLLAKLLKFGFFSYLAAYAPQKLRRFGEVREELDQLHSEPIADDPIAKP